MLKCSSCGHENEGTPKFCGKCGTAFEAAAPAAEATPVTEPAVEATPAAEPAAIKAEPVAVPVTEATPVAEPVVTAEVDSSVEASAIASSVNLDMKKVLTIAIPAVAIVVIAAIIALVLGGTSSYGEIKGFQLMETDGRTLIATPNGSSHTINEEYHSHQLSLDGSQMAVMTDWEWGYGGVLYHVSGNKAPVRIAEDVYGFIISDNGNGVAFYTNYDREHEVADLNLYNAKNKSTLRVDPNAYFSSSMEMVAISPDGKTVFYTSEDDVNQDGSTTWITMVSNRGKNDNVGRELFPIAVGDNAKFLYYNKGNDDWSQTLFVRRGINANESRLGDNPWGYSFNKDYSSIVYNSDGASYISVKGGERERLSRVDGGIISFITPEFTQARYYNGYTVYGFSDFKNKAFTSGNGWSSEIWLLNRKYETNRISNEAQNITMSQDGKWLYFMDSSRLRRASATNPDAERLTVANNVQNYTLSKKGDSVYYINVHGEMFLKKATDEGNEGKKVADDVFAYQLFTSHAGVVFFFTDYSSTRSEGMLNWTTNTKRNRVRDVSMAWADGSSVYFAILDGDFAEIHRSNGNGKFKQFARDIEDVY